MSGTRIGLAVLAVSSGVVGVWALAFPREFFDSFPGIGIGWVTVLPPFNEHLVRDVGALNLGLAVLLAASARSAAPALVAVATASWLTANVPHTIFHVRNLEAFAPPEALAQTLTQLALLALGATLFAVSWRRQPDRRNGGRDPG